MKRFDALGGRRPFYLIPVALTLFAAGCGSDPGNEPTADKTQFQAPKDSIQKPYKSGGPPAAAPPAGKPAP